MQIHINAQTDCVYGSIDTEALSLKLSAKKTVARLVEGKVLQFLFRPVVLA
jgi:hypothetical protein